MFSQGPRVAVPACPQMAPPRSDQPLTANRLPLPPLFIFSRPLVQRTEQRAHNPRAAGSNPAGPTTSDNIIRLIDPSDAPAPILPTTPIQGDNAWLQSLLFTDGSQLIDYGDGMLLVDAQPPYGQG